MGNILSALFDDYDKLQEAYEVKKKAQSDVDKELTSFYHRMEGTHFSHNTQAHKHMLKLQDILSRRRQLKLDVILLRSFLDIASETMEEVKKRSDKAIEKHQAVLDELGKS